MRFLAAIPLSVCIYALLSVSASAQQPAVNADSSPATLAIADLTGPFSAFLPLPVPRLLIRSTVAEDAATPKKMTLMFHTEIEVVAGPAPSNASEGFERGFTPREVETSAGTFGDPSRFIQTMAGVVSDNDQRNDFLVRGGNPAENGFVIDNIEIPSINQLALSDTTGGFVSMLDEAAVQRLTLHTDAYDSRFDQRLSSIVEISTRPTGAPESHSETELGIAGLGGSTTRPMGRNGSFFASARQSVLQYVTDDIGVNGVPIYRNAFLRAENRIDDRNSWWGISLTGIDSIKMTPHWDDPDETSPYTVSYSGWRNTTGLNWQHVFSARSFGIASVAHAEQAQSIQESAQLQNDATVYNEKTADRVTTLKYDWTFQPSAKVTVTAGGRASVDQLNYAVAQPIGLQDPYSDDPAPLNAGAMAHRFATASSAGYVEAVFSLPHAAKLVLGERGMQWALGGHEGATSKALLTLPVFGKLTHLGYSEYEQMPATLYLLSFNNLKTLSPIRSRQLTGGVTLAENPHARVMLEGYEKQYQDYPVAANYPQLSLANIADTFGQAFLMFPMVANGTGVARGVELTAQTHPLSRLDLTATAAYARSWYAGLDGVLRKSNYDIPFTTNLTGVWRMGHALTLSGRYTQTSGRPYTPDNMPLSIAQDRDVYDLTQINAVRSTAYHRLDFRFEQSRKVRSGLLTWHAGLENAMNNKNFYCFAWQPRANPASDAEQDQMPLFPDGGIKYSF